MVVQRDLIWHATLREMESRRTFTAENIRDAIPADQQPTQRTIRNSLNAMVSLGLLETQGGTGSAPKEYYTIKPDSAVEPAGYESRSSSQSIVFPFPGSKAGLADWIIGNLPTHDLYVEVFGGGASILVNKPKSKYEVVNDLSKDIVQFFRVLRDHGDELAEWVKNVPYSRLQYNEWATDFYNGRRPDDEIERAGRFYSLRYMQYVGISATKNGFKTRARRSPARTFSNAKDRLESLARRFDEVIIEQRHYKSILEGYDDTSIDVLFYLDPPYKDKENQYGIDIDYTELLDALSSVENDWMLSCAEVPGGFEQYHVLKRESRHKIKRSEGLVIEHLVCNFDINDRDSFEDNNFK